MAAVCDAHGPSLPSGGTPAKATGLLRGPAESKPPYPAAKLNTGESETALLSRRASPSGTEITLLKINRPAREEQIFESKKRKKRVNMQSLRRRVTMNKLPFS